MIVGSLPQAIRSSTNVFALPEEIKENKISKVQSELGSPSFGLPTKLLTIKANSQELQLKADQTHYSHGRTHG